MTIFGRPKNYWGWLRIIALVLFISVVSWGLFAAVLRLLGDVSWMSWSKYPAFGGQEILEFSILPFLAIIFSTLLEDRNHRYAAYLAKEEEAEREMSAKRKEILIQFEQALSTVQPGTREFGETLNTYLPEMDEIGKGQLLQFFYQKGYLKKSPALNLQNVDFREAVLEKMQLPGVCLDQANLYHAQMSDAHLQNSSFSGTNLKRALLCGANLTGANLSGCCLHVANLDGANLQGADLTGADISGAFFRKANLKNCVVDLAVFEEAVLIETILPDGQKTTNQKGVAFIHKKDLEAAINGL